MTRTTVFATVALSLALATASSARTISETIVGGGLGQTMTLTVSSTPGAQYLILMSLSTGPTILPPPHVSPIDVGLDLASISVSIPGFLGTLPGSGSVALGLPVPSLPALDNLNVNFQSFRIQGGAFFAEKSNLWRVTFDTPGQYLQTLNPLLTARAFATASRLGDGTVLVAGGGTGSLTSSSGLNSAEIYRPNLEKFETTGNLSGARALHRAVVLNDGRVLVVGGVDAGGNPVATAETYDPVTHVFTPVGSMTHARMGHTASKLPDGRVLVAGGNSAVSSTDPTAFVTSATASTELFDPVTNTFSAGPNLAEPKTFHEATTLSNGKVLVSGGLSFIVIIVPIPTISNKAQVYTANAGAGSFASSVSMGTARAGHTAALLDDGRVLIVGGGSGSLLAPTILATCELYNPVGNSFSGAGSLTRARALAGLTRLPDGRILASGGGEGSLTSPNAVDTNEAYTAIPAAAGSWGSAGTMTTSRLGHGAVLLDDLTVGLIGGAGGLSGTTLGTAEIHQP